MPENPSKNSNATSCEYPTSTQPREITLGVRTSRLSPAQAMCILHPHTNYVENGPTYVGEDREVQEVRKLPGEAHRQRGMRVGVNII